MEKGRLVRELVQSSSMETIPVSSGEGMDEGISSEDGEKWRKGVNRTYKWIGHEGKEKSNKERHPEFCFKYQGGGWNI